MIEWPCAACREPQVSLGRQDPPADRLCHECRAEQNRPPLGALLAGAGVPSDFRRHVTREAWMEYFHRPAFALAANTADTDWPGEEDRWLCLWGPTGTGKTSAATVLLAEHLQSGGRGLWVDGMSLLDALGREMDAGGERTVLPRLLTTPFLVLDEPFAGYLTDYAASRMLLLIRGRDQNGLRTIVTSQLDPEGLAQLACHPKYPTGALGAAMSRILSGLVVEIDGPDERLARAKKGRGVKHKQQPATVPLAVTLPHSEETERAVLGAVLLEPGLLAKILSRLQAADFYLERHQLLLRAMAGLHAEGTEVDLRTLQARLEQHGKLEEAGGLAYLAALDLDLPDLGRIDAYLDIVAERSARRAMVALAGETIRDGLGPTAVEETLARLQTQVPRLLASAVRPRLHSLREILPPLLEQIDDRGGEALRGLATGFPGLDALTAGLQAGHLIIIAGRPGLGKSAFASNVAQNIAIRQGRPVGIWSLEMTEQELALRMLCSEADVPITKLRQSWLSRAQWRRLVQAQRTLSEAPVYVDDTPGQTLAQLAARIRRAREEQAIELAIVDYLQLILSGGKRAETRNLEIAEYTRTLKNLAKSLGVPMIVLSQLSRDVTKRAGFRPALADLRESGAIESDADLVLFVHREHAYNPAAPAGEALGIVAKSRHGATGDVPLLWVGETTTFRPAALTFAAGPVGKENLF